MQTIGLLERQCEMSLDNETLLLFHPGHIDRKLLQYRVQILIDQFETIMGDDEFKNTI